MTYDEMLQRLFALRRFGMSAGLEGMHGLLLALGRPERDLALVHVGGTNGKGSTTAFVEAALRAHGLVTGAYTSPHLLRFSERIRIGGVEIGRDEVAGLAERVLAVSGDATFFEVVTAMAFLAFAERRVDVAVVEVGLGGRLDATNVVERPLCTVVASVGRDHMDILGETLPAIAREKAGIWRREVPAIFACEDDEAAAVLTGGSCAGRGRRRRGWGATSTTAGCRRWGWRAPISGATRPWRGRRSWRCRRRCGHRRGRSSRASAACAGRGGWSG